MLRPSASRVLMVIFAMALTCSIWALPTANAPAEVGAAASLDVRDVDVTAHDRAASAEAVLLDRRDAASRLDERVMWVAGAMVALTWLLRPGRRRVIGGGAERLVARWFAGSPSPRAPPAEPVVRGRTAPRPLTLLQS